MAEAVRIALLARAGKARDQLHTALSEAGANIVAEGDPAQMEPAQVASHRPNFFLVSLEPAMEVALERFDELFAGEDVEVMFDDAEVTAGLDGWDLNRWARHLAHKVLNTSDLMPPLPAGTPAWGELVAEEIVLGDDEDDDLSDSVSMDAGTGRSEGGVDLDMDLSDLSLPEAAPASAGAVSEFGELDFDESVSFSSETPAEPQTGGLDFDMADLTAQLESFDKGNPSFDDESDLPAPAVRQSVDELIASVGAQGIEEIDAVEAFEAPAAPAAPTPAPAPSFDFSNLELAPMEEGAPANATPSANAATTDETAPTAEAAQATTTGAVVVLAGLGGPDAVRQLLSSLPDSLPVPVLLYQHLEVGKHERLVDQLAKISKLPVQLARDSEFAPSGRISLLPAGMTARAQGNGLVFVTGALAQMLASVSPADSVVIVLSGADPQLVPAILAVRDAGGLVLAQDPEVCFDSAAADAMLREGAAVYPALGLARQVAARWSA